MASLKVNYSTKTFLFIPTSILPPCITILTMQDALLHCLVLSTTIEIRFVLLLHNEIMHPEQDQT